MLGSEPEMSFALNLNPHSVLVAQITTLQKDIDHALATLGNSPATIGVGGLIKSRLANELRQNSTELKYLLETVVQNAGTGDFPRAQQVLQDLRTICEGLFSEVLGVLLAPAARASDIDGICALADQLLGEISGILGDAWPHQTSLSEGEFITTSARLIRLKFPVYSIWDIPVAAHEFGHYFGPIWKGQEGRRPYDQFLRREDFAPRSHLREYFADLFAVYVLGPAYACTCLVSRFNASEVRDSDTHPSARKRAQWILTALDNLIETTDDEDDAERSRRFAQALRDFWAVATGETDVESADSRYGGLRSECRKLFIDLALEFAPAAYRNMSRAVGLAHSFRQNHFSPSSPTANSPLMSDVLNAAWLQRLMYSNIEDQQQTLAIDHWAKRISAKSPQVASQGSR
jgi:hypothetical protein